MSTQIQTAIRHNGSEAGPRASPSAVSGHMLGIVLATFMGGWHLLWSLLVLLGWAQPVIAGGKLYLRDQDVLLCYDVKGK